METTAAVTVEPTILTRELNAPIEKVFEVWTQAEHLQQWMVPNKEFGFEFLEADIREGGQSFHKLIAPSGFEMYLHTIFQEITEPHTISFLQYVTNENREPQVNPQMPDWPKHMLTTIRLEEAGPGKTLLQLFWQPVNATEAEAKTFEMTRSEHDKGWGSGLDQLVDYVNR